MWNTRFTSAAILAVSAILNAGEPPRDWQAQKASTELRIRVTGGDDAVPVKGATVYVEWQEDGKTRYVEGTTNSDGVAGPYEVPRATVFVQITTDEAAWESYGADHELKQKQETLKINLKKKKSNSAG